MCWDFSATTFQPSSGSFLTLCERYSVGPLCHVNTLVWQASIRASREMLCSKEWRKPVSIIWGLKDRWLDFRGVEDFAKLASVRLVQLPEVSCLSHSLPCILSLLLLEGHRGDVSVYAWSLVTVYCLTWGKSCHGIMIGGVSKSVVFLPQNRVMSSVMSHTQRHRSLQTPIHLFFQLCR